MPYVNGIFCNTNYIKQFYASLKLNGFVNISEERKQILDNIISNNAMFYKAKDNNLLPLICDLAYVFLYVPKRFSLENDDEKIYLFINFIDPELKFLEAYECASLREEIKANCLLNFRYYDAQIINFEQMYNDYFNLYDQSEIWCRESIKRARIKK